MTLENPRSEASVSQVGPYRVERLLGRGGMGEVHAGYDERLDRPVALKRVWRDDGDETRRKRFQREARAVARLHHPAIVQVFDWVESEDDDWIVMEYVQGRSLRELMNESLLESGRALRILRDLLEGLAVAHDAGIVHRDLKAENVMVAPDSAPGKVEQAKILDFGLAKRFDPEDPETQLSVEGGLIGTLTAMSPEQVHGREVGPRSDLFSLGSLLYEMLTGTSPFRGATAAETLQKICAWNPPSPRDLEPTVPSALISFIERLLHKDFRQRPADAKQALADLVSVEKAIGLPDLTLLSEPARDFPQSTFTGHAGRAAEALRQEAVFDSGKSDLAKEGSGWEGVSTSFEPFDRPFWKKWVLSGGLLGLLVWVGFWLSTPDTRALHVVVPHTIMESSPLDFDPSLATRAITTGLLRGLLTFENLVAVEPEQDADSLKATEDLIHAMAGDEALTSSLTCTDRFNCQLILRRVQGDGTLIWTQAFDVDPTALLDTSLAVIGHLRHGYPEAKLRDGLPDLQVRAEDYRRYLELQDQYVRRTAGFSTTEAVAELEQLQETSPHYPALPLFEARILNILFQENRNAAHLEQAKEALERARRIAPEHPQVLIGQVHLARIAGDIATAKEVLQTFRRLHPGSIHRFYLEARILEQEGRFEEAFRIMREGIEQRPSIYFLVDYSGMLSRRGRLEEARKALELALERVPNFYSGLSRLAQLELLNGSPSHAAKYYERLVARSPEATELTNLGTAYLLTRRYADAAEKFRQALELSPSSIPTLLNLADAEGLAGQDISAAELYQRVLHGLDNDPNPQALLTVRAQALAHLERAPEAVSAIQDALRQNPDNPMTAYEASLVFVLVGDYASAQWNARQALEYGVDPRWFTFPWFDPLRVEIDGLVAEGQNGI